MRKIVCSKWSRRFLWLIIIPTFLIYEYIFLFIGIGNTYIDNACFILCLITMGLTIVRKFVIAYWTYDENE